MNSTYDWVKLCETSEYTFNIAYAITELKLHLTGKNCLKGLKADITNDNMSEEFKDIFIHIENLYNYIQSQSNYKVCWQENKLVVIVKIQMPFSNTKQKFLEINLQEVKEQIRMVNRYSETPSDVDDLRRQIQMLRKQFQTFRHSKPNPQGQFMTVNSFKQKINEETEIIIDELQNYLGTKIRQVMEKIDAEVKKLQKKDDDLIKYINAKTQSNTESTKLLNLQRKCNQIAQQAKRIQKKIDTQVKFMKQSLNQAFKDIGKKGRKKTKTNIFSAQNEKVENKDQIQEQENNNSVTQIMPPQQFWDFRQFCDKNYYTNLSFDRKKPFMGRYKIDRNLIVYNNKKFDDFRYFIFST